MNLNQLISQIPKPILVTLVLVIALAFIVSNDPLRDECDMQIKIFEKNTAGILRTVKRKKKNQFAQMTYWKDLCREGNSLGACEDYFGGLAIVAREVKSFNQNCQIKYVEKTPEVLTHFTNALQIVPLLAWGEKPPEGIQQRMGWLTEAHIRSFCAIKNFYITVAGDEEYLKLREKVYALYPDQWDEKIPVDERKPNERPKAYKTALNPDGKLKKEEVYERSLFSIRCDLYM